MKKIFFLAILMLSASAFATEDYQIYKKIIVETTQARIESAKRGDIAGICNSLKLLNGTDTRYYYIAFEMLETENKISTRLREELGPFFYRNFVQMNQQRLPTKLHIACTDRSWAGVAIGSNRQAILDAVKAIEDIYIQE